MDETLKTDVTGSTQINVQEDYEVSYWAAKFEVSAEELREAIQAVGPQLVKVDDYLSSNN